MGPKVATPALSIVVLVGPTDNPLLASCLESIRKSSWRNYEIILVVNSASKIRVRALVRSYPYIRVISMGRNAGVAGYNRGIEKSRAPFIFFLDEDCEVEKQTLSRIVQALKSSPKKVAAVAGNVFNVRQKQFFYHHLPQGNGTLFTFPGGATAFKKEALVDAGLFDEDFFLWLHEDDMALNLLSRGYRITFHDNITIRHHDEEAGFRPHQAYLIFRNKAWLNLKHFSFFFLPVLLVRDIVWIVSFSLYKKIPAAVWSVLSGYVRGYMTAPIALKKRRLLPWKLQNTLLKHYLSYRNR